MCGVRFVWANKYLNVVCGRCTKREWRIMYSNRPLFVCGFVDIQRRAARLSLSLSLDLCSNNRGHGTFYGMSHIIPLHVSINDAKSNQNRETDLEDGVDEGHINAMESPPMWFRSYNDKPHSFLFSEWVRDLGSETSSWSLLSFWSGICWTRDGIHTVKRLHLFNSKSRKDHCQNRPLPFIGSDVKILW